MDLICPICGSKLNTLNKSLVCAGHHCFDIARQGYVNLLTVQQKHSLHPGDTRCFPAAPFWKRDTTPPLPKL